jgi:hypothetical protein
LIDMPISIIDKVRGGSIDAQRRSISSPSKTGQEHYISHCATRRRTNREQRDTPMFVFSA